MTTALLGAHRTDQEQRLAGLSLAAVCPGPCLYGGSYWLKAAIRMTSTIVFTRLPQPAVRKQRQHAQVRAA